MVTLKKSKTRSERRAEVVKKITTNKENARAFLVRAGIVNKSGTLNKIYKWKKLYIPDVLIWL